MRRFTEADILDDIDNMDPEMVAMLVDALSTIDSLVTDMLYKLQGEQDYFQADAEIPAETFADSSLAGANLQDLT